MIAKKNPRYNLEGKRIVIFSLGLLTTTAATLAAFTYQSPLDSEIEKQLVKPIPIAYMVEEQDPIVEQKVEVIREQNDQPEDSGNSDDLTDPSDVADANSVVVSNTKTELVLKVGAPTGTKGIGIPKIDKGEIIAIPTKDAAYIGGYSAMQDFIGKKQQYPEDAILMQEQGTVYVNFVVEVDGKISNITIERGISRSLDREAKRIVQNFPSWKAGEVDGEPVRTRVLLPIKFILE